MKPWRTSVAVVLSGLLAGCVTVGIGARDAPGITYFVLEDARPASPSGAGARETLTVHGISGDPLTDSTSMVYSRQPGERSLYQLAAWTERPTRRLAQLAQERLEARGAFAAVTQLGRPAQSDWLLTLTVEQMFHDAGSTPGRAQLALRAELIDRRDRNRVATARFAAAPTIAEANAPAAVKAFAEATADVLDQLVAWVESSVQARRSH